MRNAFYFNHVQSQPMSIIATAKHMNMEYNPVQEQIKLPDIVHIDSRPLVWQKPSPRFIVVNCDASWMVANKPAGFAIVARNHFGKIIDGVFLKKICCSSIFAEALAILVAINFALKLPTNVRISIQ